MNADRLPLGYAGFVLIATSVDGEESRAGQFVSEDLAESTATFLRLHAPSSRYHVAAVTPVLPGMEGRV